MTKARLAIGSALLALTGAWPGPAWAQDGPPCPGPLKPLTVDPLAPASARASKDPGQGGRPPLYLTSGGSLCQLVVPRRKPPADQTTGVREPGPGRAFLYSVLVPGGGQRLLGQGRWTAYVALELWAWVQHLEKRREGRALQKKYRDLAWLVARRVSSGRRIDAGWAYYESMAQFISSGAYDILPSVPGVQPETDPETFNGSIWALAQGIFFPEEVSLPLDEDSEPYKRALAYYVGRAYPAHLTWDWGDNALHRLEFQDLIDQSDENLRRSTTMVGVILANHLLSAVDAFVSARLRAEGRFEGDVELIPLPTQPGAIDVGLVMNFRIPLPSTR